MRTFFLAIALFFTLTGAYAAEDVKLDCATWGVWPNEQKNMYLAGYGDAVGLLGLGGAVGGNSPQEIQKLVYLLWPQGYNLGKLVDELDKLCSTEQFKKTRLSLVIAGLAAKAQRAK